MVVDTYFELLVGFVAFFFLTAFSFAALDRIHARRKLNFDIGDKFEYVLGLYKGDKLVYPIVIVRGFEKRHGQYWVKYEDEEGEMHWIDADNFLTGLRKIEE